VLVLIEEHYDETEFNVFNEFFPRHDIEVEYASYLWGNDTLTFEGNDKTSKVEVSLCVSKIDLAEYQGLILIGGYAMDRLRYEETSQRNQSSPCRSASPQSCCLDGSRPFGYRHDLPFSLALLRRSELD